MSSPLISQLKPIRQAAKLTQAELAARLGWADHTHVSNVERGVRGTNLEDLERWIDACQCDVYLVSRSVQAGAGDLRSALSTASEDDQAILLRLARILPHLDASERDRLQADVEYLERRHLGR